jgi:hypothetical protein
MQELKILDTEVIEAANKHPEAKAVLKTLFPEAFKEAIKPGDFVKLQNYPKSSVLLVLGGDSERVIRKQYAATITDRELIVIQVSGLAGIGTVYSYRPEYLVKVPFIYTPKV